MSERSDSLREQFGDIDVYLFDQLLRGRNRFGNEGIRCRLRIGKESRFSSCAPGSMCGGE